MTQVITDNDNYWQLFLRRCMTALLSFFCSVANPNPYQVVHYSRARAKSYSTWLVRQRAWVHVRAGERGKGRGQNLAKNRLSTENSTNIGVKSRLYIADLAAASLGGICVSRNFPRFSLSPAKCALYPSLSTKSMRKTELVEEYFENNTLGVPRCLLCYATVMPGIDVLPPPETTM